MPRRKSVELRQRRQDDANFRAIEASKKRQAHSARTLLGQVKRELGLTSGKRNRDT
jgi:hypothetical protein